MGAKNRTQIQVYLGTQPRLLHEMLQLALSHLLENAKVTEVDAQKSSWFQLDEDADNKTAQSQWLVISPGGEGSMDKRIEATLAQHNGLKVATLAPDARTLHVYGGVQEHSAKDNGAKSSSAKTNSARNGRPEEGTTPGKRIHQTTYHDFSLVQLVEILQETGA